jgi:antitoxin (DNA-binding transcriptional repressor) of toxin-antitoxin stability system
LEFLKKPFSGLKNLDKHSSVNSFAFIGERLEVTEHGRPVAVLAPIGEPDSPIERLVAAGRAIAPSVDITTLLPPKGRTSTRTSEALLEDRRDRV